MVTRFNLGTARREELTANLERFRRTRQAEAVHIPIASDVFSCDMESLGPGVQLRKGKLEVEFADPLDTAHLAFPVLALSVGT